MGSDLSARLGAALTRRGLCVPRVRYHAPDDRPEVWRSSDGTAPLPEGSRLDLADWPTVGVLLGLLAGEREVAVFGPSAPCVVDIWRVAWTAPDGWPHAFDEEAPSKLGRIGDALAAALLAAWGEP
jgi:hypothetical protein